MSGLPRWQMGLDGQPRLNLDIRQRLTREDLALLLAVRIESVGLDRGKLIRRTPMETVRAMVREELKWNGTSNMADGWPHVTDDVVAAIERSWPGWRAAQ